MEFVQWLRDGSICEGQQVDSCSENGENSGKEDPPMPL